MSTRKFSLFAVIAGLFISLHPAISPNAFAAACSVSYGTVSGTTRYAIFNSGSGCTWNVPAGVTSISYLAVGGGGGGGGARAASSPPNLGGGGGGAGGRVNASSFSTTSGSTITITVGTGGAGGAASTNGSNGNSTSITYSSTTITAAGGNGGGGSTGAHEQANLSGDGGSNSGYTGGASDWDGGGGGAGSNGNGSNGVDIGGQGGNGGAGGSATLNTLLGVNNYYGGGGGGGGTPSTNSNETDGTGGAGGNSVGGNGGGRNGVQPTAGAANTGSGGGGGGWRSASSDALRAGAAGSDGTVIFVFTKTAGSISSISITSSSGSDNTYAIGNLIQVRVVTSEAVSITGSPRIPVLGLTSKFYTYSSGSGTTSLVFNYTVVENDSATAGIGVTANSLELNSGSMTDTAGLAITLSHVSIAQSTSHMVDGIYPAFVGVNQSISVPENETRTINLTTTEPATFAYTAGSDTAFFILDNAAQTLTLTPRDFENKMDADANNVYYIGMTISDLAGNRTGGRNFNFTITNVAESASLGALSLSSSARKGIPVSISLTSNVAGRFTFFANGKRISGCVSRPTSGTSPNFSGTCFWKPTTTANVRLTAALVPTDSSYSTTTSSTISVNPSRRDSIR